MVLGGGDVSYERGTPVVNRAAGLEATGDVGQRLARISSRSASDAVD